MKAIDRTGRKYGMLTALKATDERGVDGSLKWFCRCDCGNEIVTSTFSTTGGCGCLRQKPPGEGAQNSLLATYRCAARRKNHSFELTKEDFRHLIVQSCFYCGAAPSRIAGYCKKYGGNFTYNGLDRIDNALGYTLDNVVSCCRTCNYAKGAKSYKEFMEWIDRLVDQHSKRGR